MFDGDFWKKCKQLSEINKKQKETNCKFCGTAVVFNATGFKNNSGGGDKVSWECLEISGTNHTTKCLGKPNYVPKFTKKDVILTKWNEHKTMYIIEEVLKDSSEYCLSYHSSNGFSSRGTTIPIKAIDNRSTKCDKEMIGAIYGE